MIRYLWEKMLKWGWDYNRDLKTRDYDLAEITLCETTSPVSIDGLNFTVMLAQGGTIVQLRRYDNKKERYDTVTHIVAEGQDLAEHVGKIVAMELWKA